MRWGRAHWWIAGSAIAVYFCLVMKFVVNVPVDDDYDNIFKFYFQLDHMRAPIDIAQVFLSLYTQANGLLAVLVNAAWLLCQAMYTNAPHAKRRLALWALLCVGPVGMYFAHFVPASQEPSIAESLAHPFRITAYFLAYVGSGVGYLGIGAAIAAGTWLTCLAAYLTYRGYFSRQPALYAFYRKADALHGGAAILVVSARGVWAATERAVPHS